LARRTLRGGHPAGCYTFFAAFFFATFFVAFFLLPAMGMAGPAAAPVMGALVKRKLFTIIPTVAVITMLAGLRMMWINSTGFEASYFAATGGRTYVVGAVLAVAAFTLFMVVNHPAIGRIMQLGQLLAQASEAERGPLMAQMNAVRARAGKASVAAAVLLTLAAVTMAVGRYL
jgi:hypothetical protein